MQGCATYQIPDFNTYVTLPASGRGHRVSTLSGEEEYIEKAIWDERKKRAILLFSEDWVKIRSSFINQCLTHECQQSVGALDSIFAALDDALGKMPGIK